eukprot:3571666-Amphidinium_carterae.1
MQQGPRTFEQKQLRHKLKTAVLRQNGYGNNLEQIFAPRIIWNKFFAPRIIWNNSHEAQLLLAPALRGGLRRDLRAALSFAFHTTWHWKSFSKSGNCLGMSCKALTTHLHNLITDRSST